MDFADDVFKFFLLNEALWTLLKKIDEACSFQYNWQ